MKDTAIKDPINRKEKISLQLAPGLSAEMSEELFNCFLEAEIEKQKLEKSIEIISIGEEEPVEKDIEIIKDEQVCGELLSVAALGYGTLQTNDFDEDPENRPCDSPSNKINRENAQRQQNFSSQKSNNQNSSQNEPKKATTKQKTLIYSLINKLDLTKEQVEKVFYECSKKEIKSANDLLIRDASQVIEYLKNYEPAGPALDEKLYDEFEGERVRLFTPLSYEGFPEEPPPEEPPF